MHVGLVVSEELAHSRVDALLKLVGLQASDGMFHNNEVEIILPLGPSLCLRQRQERIGHDRDCIDTALAQFNRVVDTPRRTRPSISYRKYRRLEV